MDDTQTVYYIESVFWERRRGARGLNYVEEDVPAKMAICRIYSVAQVDADQLTHLRACHIVGKSPDADPNLQDKSVPHRLTSQVEQEMYTLLHVSVMRLQEDCPSQSWLIHSLENVRRTVSSPGIALS